MCVTKSCQHSNTNQFPFSRWFKVTFSSPIVEAHLTIWVRVTYITIPKKVTKTQNCQASLGFVIVIDLSSWTGSPWNGSEQRCDPPSWKGTQHRFDDCKHGMHRSWCHACSKRPRFFFGVFFSDRHKKKWKHGEIWRNWIKRVYLILTHFITKYALCPKNFTWRSRPNNWN